MPLILPFGDHHPRLGKGVFVADSASIVGDIELGENSSVWYGCVLRGDVGKIRIGERVNIQDLSCIHMTTDISDALIEDDVSVGHSVVVHGAIIETGVLVGMGSVLMDNARIGAESIVGAGSLITAGTQVPPRSLVLGRPAKVVRELSAEEAKAGRATATKYVGLAETHRRAQPPPTK